MANTNQSVLSFVLQTELKARHNNPESSYFVFVMPIYLCSLSLANSFERIVRLFFFKNKCQINPANEIGRERIKNIIQLHLYLATVQTDSFFTAFLNERKNIFAPNAIFSMRGRDQKD